MLSLHLLACWSEGLFGNVHRKGHRSICCRDAIHNGGQGPHVPVLWRVCSTQKICKKTQSDTQHLWSCIYLPNETKWTVLTLTAVALRALLWSAAPLRATAAGAAWTGLAWRRHLLPWRCTHTSCCQSLCYDTAHHTTPLGYNTHCSVVSYHADTCS